MTWQFQCEDSTSPASHLYLRTGFCPWACLRSLGWEYGLVCGSACPTTEAEHQLLNNHTYTRKRRCGEAANHQPGNWIFTKRCCINRKNYTDCWNVFLRANILVYLFTLLLQWYEFNLFSITGYVYTGLSLNAHIYMFLSVLSLFSSSCAWRTSGHFSKCATTSLVCATVNFLTLLTSSTSGTSARWVRH